MKTVTTTLTPSLLRRCTEDLGRLVQQIDFATLVECAALLQDRFDVEGDGSGSLALNRAGAGNIILWQPCSEHFSAVIAEALGTQRIFAWPSVRQAYGKHALALPIAHGPYLYTERVWMPIVFRPIAFDETADVQREIELSAEASVLRSYLAGQAGQGSVR